MRSSTSALMLVLAAAFACKPESREAESREAESREAESSVISANQPLPEPKMVPGRDPLSPLKPPFEATLPPAPAATALAAPEVPLRYDGGVVSVRGLREDVEAQLKAGNANEVVTVRGHVSAIESPLPACPRAGSCDPSHFWLTDAPGQHGRRRALLVGPYRYAIPEWDLQLLELFAGEPELEVAVGQQVTCKGVFRIRSEHGLRDRRGMLELWSCWHEPSGAWIYPRNAPWHPKLLAQPSP